SADEVHRIAGQLAGALQYSVGHAVGVTYFGFARKFISGAGGGAPVVDRQRVVGTIGRRGQYNRRDGPGYRAATSSLADIGGHVAGDHLAVFMQRGERLLQRESTLVGQEKLKGGQSK